jgi:hypothetical protein
MLTSQRNLHISFGWMEKKVQSHVTYYGIFMAIKALLDMQMPFYTDTDHESNYKRGLEYSISLHVRDFKHGDGK